MHLQRDGDRLTIALPERLTRCEAAGCFRALHAALTPPPAAVTVDAAAVTAWDDSGLAALLVLQRRCREAQIPLAFTGARPELLARLDALGEGDGEETLAATREFSLPIEVANRTLSLLEVGRRLIAYVGDVGLGLWQVARHPRRVRWRDTLYYMDRCGTDALPIVMLICFLMGLILGFQAALQLHQFGADSFVADLVGLSIVRELGPLMVAMICTGRAGSAFAAEIGTMKVAEEVDALVTMGLDPTRFLIVPKLLALLFVMPILTLFGNLLGVLGGFVVGTLSLDIPTSAYLLRTANAIAPFDLVEGLTKSAVFALLIAGVGCLRGFEARNSAQAVGRATTSAVVSGIFLVIVADTLLTILFSRFRG